MSPKWHLLQLAQDSSPTPPLLLNYRFTETSYIVHLTDLTRIWAECLDRRAICARAAHDESSIDPSEDAQQLGILLRKIEAALGADGGTTLTLDPGARHGLKLTITSPLPAPLRPLRWSMYLAMSDPHSLTDHVVVPLLEDLKTRSSQVQSLLEQIRNKDHVIDKLVTQLEASAIDLATVFPGAAGLKNGRKLPSREQAGKVVKGLAVFEEGKREVDGGNGQKLGQDLASFASIIAGADESLQPARALRDGHDRQWWTHMNVQLLAAAPSTPDDVVPATKDGWPTRPPSSTRPHQGLKHDDGAKVVYPARHNSFLC